MEPLDGATVFSQDQFCPCPCAANAASSTDWPGLSEQGPAAV